MTDCQKRAQQKIIQDYHRSNELNKFIRKTRQQGKKVVLTQGSYDIVHVGHARYLYEAKCLGDVLIVGVDSDEKVKTRKGPNRPIVPENERLEMLTYLRSVDLVVLKKESDPKWSLIKAVKPDILVATQATYKQEEINKLEEYCGKVVVLEPQATTSTSAKIRRVQIGAARKIKATLSNKLVKTIEEVLEELKR